MQKLFIVLLVFSTFSCATCYEGEPEFPLKDTHWNLYYKNNSTFSFFAESELHFDSDTDVLNYRNFDTISGNWKSTLTTVTINFDNDDIYTGTIITNDSISGTLTASGNNGVWHAIRK